MTEGFFIEKIGPEVVADFANGGHLAKGAVFWTYRRDEAVSNALDPELAVRGVEGDGEGILIWKGI